jgi:hypothetical protein
VNNDYGTLISNDPGKTRNIEEARIKLNWDKTPILQVQQMPMLPAFLLFNLILSIKCISPKNYET